MDVFSARLKWLREERRLSQQQMADKLGLSQSYYGRFERNKGEPNLETLARIQPIIGESIDFLIGITDFTFNAQRMYDEFVRSKDNWDMLVLDLERLEIDPESNDILFKDFDPNDPKSVAEKITNLRKQIPLWKNRTEICRDKVLASLKQIPMVKPTTIEGIVNFEGWLKLFRE